MFQEVKKFYPMVQGLDYNADLKNEMVLKTQNLIQKRRLKFDSGDNDIVTSFMTVKKRITGTERLLMFLTVRKMQATATYHGQS